MKRSISLFFLKSFAVLPLGALYLLSDMISIVLQYIVRYRKKVVRRNLMESFPGKSGKEISRIERKFYRFLSDQIFETLKLFHISDRELKKRVKIEGYEQVNESLENSRSAVIFMGHYGNWEWVQEISRYFIPEAYMASIYHPLSNKLWDEIFIQLRSRWGAHILPMKSATRTLLNKANRPWVCGFIADAFTRYKNEDNYTDFLNHKTWFITGPEDIGKRVGADFYYLDMEIEGRGKYRYLFKKLDAPLSSEEPYPITRLFWKEFQATIDRAPAYWLWSHKRWK